MSVIGAIIAGVALVAGALSTSSNSYVSVSTNWNDDVGGELTNMASSACSDVNNAISNCKSAFQRIENLPPVEFKSEADNINRIINEINRITRSLN